jgi:hypothetical protein
MAAEQGGRNVPWPVAVSFLIQPLPEVFSLPEVYAIAEPVRKAFPNNHHVNAKIRQSLQILRDRGEIAFDGGGQYRKVRATPPKSVRLDFGEAAGYASRAQVARVAVEAWVGRNIDCWRCGSALLLVPPNTQLMDAVCRDAGHEVQVKAISGIADDRLTGAAFSPMARRLVERTLPDYLLVSYDRPRSVVLLAEFVDGKRLTGDRVTARPPLRAGARRAGWVGATIDVSGLERRVIGGPSFEPEITSWP